LIVVVIKCKHTFGVIGGRFSRQSLPSRSRDSSAIISTPSSEADAFKSIDGISTKTINRSFEELDALFCASKFSARDGVSQKTASSSAENIKLRKRI